MNQCQFCGEEDDLELDKHNQGFWCECCDGYTYFDKEKEKNRFLLLLEDKHGISMRVRSNKKLKRQLSPLRYPGGKSKMISLLYSKLQKDKTDCLVSPFTGGGSFELSMLEADVVKQLHLNDLDMGIYALWWTMKYAPDELIDRLKYILPTKKDYFQAQKAIRTEFRGATLFDAAWSTLLVNRLAYSGIAKANPLGGKNGDDAAMLARWNPAELIKRVERIHSLSDRFTITQLNAVELIEEAYWDEKATIFIDPPYVEAGKALYNCFYTEKDHLQLCWLLDGLYQGMPGANLLITYDYNQWIQKIYSYPEVSVIGRTYSI